MLRTLGTIFAALLLSCGSKEYRERNTTQIEAQSVKTIVAGSMSVPIFDFDGLEPILNMQDEKTYVVNFWATWCRPCVEELPYFEKITESYSSDDVEVILVSLDMPRHWESQLVPFIKKKAIKSRVVVLDDPRQNDWIPKVDENWSGAIPATIIYNKNKRSFYERSFSSDELNNELTEFLKIGI